MIRTLVSEGGVFDGASINGCLIFFEAGLNDLADAEAPLETELNDLVRSEEPYGYIQVSLRFSPIRVLC